MEEQVCSCRSCLPVKLSSSEQIAFAISKPSPFALPKCGHTVDGLHLWGIVLFRDLSLGFEVSRDGLEIRSVPGHLYVGTTGGASASRGKDEKPRRATAPIEEAGKLGEMWESTQMVGIER